MDKQLINIDDLVRQRLAGGEEREPAGAWGRMSALLDKEEKDRKPVIFFWRRMFSVLAVLVLIGAISVGGYRLSTTIKGNHDAAPASGNEIAASTAIANNPNSNNNNDNTPASSVVTATTDQTSTNNNEHKTQHQSPIASNIKHNSTKHTSDKNPTTDQATQNQPEHVVAGNITTAHNDSHKKAHNHDVAKDGSKTNTTEPSVAVNDNKSDKPVSGSKAQPAVAENVPGNETPAASPAQKENKPSDVAVVSSGNMKDAPAKHAVAKNHPKKENKPTDVAAVNNESKKDAPAKHAVAKNNPKKENTPTDVAAVNNKSKKDAPAKHAVAKNDSKKENTPTDVAAVNNKSKKDAPAKHAVAKNDSKKENTPTDVAAVNNKNKKETPAKQAVAKNTPKKENNNDVATVNNETKKDAPAKHAVAKNNVKKQNRHKVSGEQPGNDVAVNNTPVHKTPAKDAHANDAVKQTDIVAKRNNHKKADMNNIPLAGHAATPKNTPAAAANNTTPSSPNPGKIAARTGGNKPAAAKNSHKQAPAVAPTQQPSGKAGGEVADNTPKGKRNIQKVVVQERQAKTNPLGHVLLHFDTISIENITMEYDLAKTSPADKSGVADNTPGNNTASSDATSSNTATSPQETVPGAKHSDENSEESSKSYAGTKKSRGAMALEGLANAFNDIKYHVGNAKFVPGISGGINSTFFGPNSFKGFQFGVTGSLEFSDALTLMGELKYFHRINNGYTLNDNYYSYTQVAGGYSKELVQNPYGISTLHSIELPVTIRYNKGALSFFTGINTVYSFAINTGDYPMTVVPITPVIVSAPGNDNAPKIQSKDFNAKFGLGYIFGVSCRVSDKVTIDIRDVQTFWDNSKTTGAKYISNQLYRSPSFQLSIGYSFGGKNQSKGGE